MKLFRLVYDLIIWCIGAGIWLAQPFSSKARNWIGGRTHILSKIEASLPPDGIRVWFHCASLGEFEQGRPLLENIRKDFPEVLILLTFFSPSGYQIRKNYPGADYIFYLPLDKRHNAERLVELFRPSLVIFVKYEFWYYYMLELHRRKIPVLMISAVFREQQVFFKWYGALYRQILKYYDCIFVQDEQSLQILNRLTTGNTAISGDTRFDRVIHLKQQNRPELLPVDFTTGSRVIVAGSTWPVDEKMLAGYLAGLKDDLDLKWVIAPHEISEKRLLQIERLFRGSVRLSRLPQTSSSAGIRVIVVDSMGKLGELYRYAELAYIGGGFGQGIHNILEAAVYGVPVLFGPNYHKFNEAVDLIQKGGAFPISGKLEFHKKLEQLLGDAEKLTMISKICSDFVHAHAGATDRIMNYIRGKRFLTTR